MIKVVSFTICPFVQRITAQLSAKDIPYEVEYISLNDKPQWFLDISPNAQVPLLITENNQALFESDAIAEYIDDIATPLEINISAEQKALDRAWSYMATKNYLLQCSAMRSGDEQTFEERKEKLIKIFFKVEQQINQGPLFKGEQLSNVDIAWLPLLHRMAIIEQNSGFDYLQDLPKVKRWQQSILDTELVSKSVASDFEEKFIGFYLSKNTYLGQLLLPTIPATTCNPDNACKTSSCC